MVSTRVSIGLVLSLLTSVSLILFQFWTLPIPSGRVQSPATDPSSRLCLDEAYGKLPLSFEANQGQADSQVKFLSRGGGHALFLTSTEAVLELRNEESASASEKFRKQKSSNPRSAIRTPQSIQSAVLHMRLEGANPSPEVVGLDELPGKVNYFIGNDPEKWRTDIPTYAKVKYQDVYPGVDLIYYGNQRELEYDFVVAPGADPNIIRLGFDGTDKLEVDARGDLVLRRSTGVIVETPRRGVSTTQRNDEVRMRRPLVYQEVDGIRQEIPGGYVLSEIADQESQTEIPFRNPQSVIGFQLAAYDDTKPLIIDPILAYSTYLGGSDFEAITSITVDASGNAYVAGGTVSFDFPTANALQPACAGGCGARASGGDAFVAKLNAEGSALVYSTYLGGSGADANTIEIAVDASGSAYVSGSTNSIDFPVLNPLQPAYGGGATDAFVAKLNASGSALVYSTYLGGSGSEGASARNDIAVDPAGNAYVINQTTSTNFPTTPGALQTTFGGGSQFGDVFVAKLTADGKTLAYSTYLGGSGEDRSFAMDVDAGGNAYIIGSTASANFPTLNPLQSTLQVQVLPDGSRGGQDLFVTKFDPRGALAYSTYLGGSLRDGGVGGGIAVDAVGNVYLAGETVSRDFPTVNALQPAYSGGASDAIVAKLAADGRTLVYSTYLGGSGTELGGTRIAVDSSGNAYVSGNVASTDFPTANALQPAYGGGATDAYVAKLSPDGRTLVYSTYLGGSGQDNIPCITIDSSGNVYAAGFTGSTNFPTANALQPTYAGGQFDGYVAKISEILASGDFYFAQVGGGGGFSTGIFLTNPSTTKSVSGTVSFFGSNGRPLEGVVENAVVPFVTEPSGTSFVSTSTQGALRSGYVRVSSSDPVFANATYSLAGLPSLSVAPSDPPAYAFRARVSRNRSGGIDVGVSAVNISDQRVTAVFSLFDSGGRAIRSLRAARALSPGEQVSETLGALFLNLPASFEGTLRITALSPLPSQSLVVSAVRFGPGLFSAVPLVSLAKPSLGEEGNVE